MKTLVFCTSYCESLTSWQDRHGLWLRDLRSSKLRFDQLLIVDDGSPVLPDWPDLAVVRETDAARPDAVVSDAPAVLYAHTTRLGRQSVFEFPGWHRSFAFGVLYGAAHGFEKIIHVESDAHLVSERLQTYLDEYRQGWSACWCEAYQFPEITVQVAAGAALADLVAFVKRPYADMEGQIHELLFPFTHVERLFVGNRYGESIGHVPRQADYSSQTLVGLSQDYYWWIPAEPRAKAEPRPRVGVATVRAPFSGDMLAGSWGGPEPDCVWMLDFDSSLFIPSVEQDGVFDLEIEIFPCTYKHRTSQRLHILVNDRLVNAVSIHRATTITSRIPPGVLHTDQLNCVRFLHPDAFAPCEIGDHPEARRLALALRRCDLSLRPEA